jgi:hypothetical protein
MFIEMLTAAALLAPSQTTFADLEPAPGTDVYAMESPVDGLPVCRSEDGDPSGQPCVWVDPDTGWLYFSDSANYR